MTQQVHITLDREIVVLVLEATEAAASDAVEVLELAKAALVAAEEAVRKAQLDASSASTRAGFVRAKVKLALVEDARPEILEVEVVTDAQAGQAG